MLGLPASKILVLEDDPRVCESIQFLLSNHGYSAHSSNDLSSALKSLQTEDYDVVLLDLKLGNQCGFAVMDQLIASERDTQVVVVTGMKSEKKAITALKKGAADYLKKPFEPDDLLSTVQRVLGLREQKRKKEKLKSTIASSRERYRAVIDSQNEFLCRLNTKFEITFVNKAYANYCGPSPQVMIGQQFKQVMHKSIHKHISENLSIVRSGSILPSINFRSIDAKGHRRWQQWQFQGILNEDEELVEIQCVGRDVTQSKLQTEAIKKKKERYRQLAEMTSDWLWEVDGKGVYTYASPISYELIGYHPDEILGKRPFDFMPSDEAQRMEGIFQKAMMDGKSLKAIENVNLHKNGHPITLETSGVPLFGSQGKIVGYRGIDRNISARKFAERRLKEESEKLKRALRKVKLLSGMLPICSSCKRIRDDAGYWQQIESYITDHSEAEFSHGICPNCARKLYPEIYKDKPDNQ